MIKFTDQDIEKLWKVLKEKPELLSVNHIFSKYREFTELDKSDVKVQEAVRHAFYTAFREAFTIIVIVSPELGEQQAHELYSRIADEISDIGGVQQ